MNRLALVVLVTLIVTTASAEELRDRAWVELRSPHFVIVSAASEKRTIKLSHDLEAFHAAVAALMNFTEPRRVPWRIYVLPRWGYSYAENGLIAQTMRANNAAFASTKPYFDEFANSYLAYFLINNAAPLEYPLWFADGLAAVLATTRSNGTVIEYGRPATFYQRQIVEHRFATGWLPFAELIDTRRDSRISAFTPLSTQCWALVHYLKFGRADRRFDDDRRKFFELIQQGANPVDAFEPAFGIAVAQLEVNVASYVADGVRSYNATVDVAPQIAPLRVVPVSADATAVQVGLLRSLAGEFNQAADDWEAALSINPNQADALAYLGGVRRIAKQWDAAQPYYEKAIAIEPQNAYHELDYGEYCLERAQTTTDAANITSDLAEARRHFAASYALDPTIPETLAMQGSSYLFPGESTAKAFESLTAAHALLPTHPTISLLLAKAYQQSGDRDSAVKLLRLLVAQSDADSAREASRLLEQITQPKNE